MQLIKIPGDSFIVEELPYRIKSVDTAFSSNGCPTMSEQSDNSIHFPEFKATTPGPQGLSAPSFTIAVSLLYAFVLNHHKPMISHAMTGRGDQPDT